MTADEFSAAYDRDPRLEWSPLMRNYQPKDMYDLTPPELDALVAAATVEEPRG